MIDYKELSAPFEPEDIEWRVQQAGAKDGKQWAMVLAYVTNRAIQQRLDDVVGPENWKNEFVKGPDGGVMCGISIKTESGEWVEKWDGSNNTDIEAVKGGLSGSMKRSAVQWGIGRYLYNLEAMFAIINKIGKHYQKGVQGKYEAFKWSDPELPKWALPEKKKGDYSLFIDSIEGSESQDHLLSLGEEFKKLKWTPEEFSEINKTLKSKWEDLKNG